VPNNPLRELLPLRILVVDDDAFVGMVNVEHYSALGCEVEYASGAAAALQMIERRQPDLILCDRRMPDMSGAELLEEIRRRGPEWQKAAFVFVTALTDRRDRYAMMSLHPDGYLGKPIDFDQEDPLLARILRARRSGTAVPE
jgi:CheY-like chemotaxis protein